VQRDRRELVGDPRAELISTHDPDRALGRQDPGGGELEVAAVERDQQAVAIVALDRGEAEVLVADLRRLGCQLAGDGDWGRETTLPWGMAYPNAIVGWDYPPGVRVHPTPLYEFAAYTAVFLFLWSIRTRPLRDGTLFWLYLVLACGARFAIEFIRINPPFALGLTQAQVTSLALVAIGAWQLVVSSRPASPPSRPGRPRAA